MQPNPAKGTVDIEWQVEEQSNDQIELSGGWGGYYGFVGTLGLTFNNFSLQYDRISKTGSPCLWATASACRCVCSQRPLLPKLLAFSFSGEPLAGRPEALSLHGKLQQLYTAFALWLHHVRFRPGCIPQSAQQHKRGPWPISGVAR